jgi:hypothetical protein
MVFDLDAHTKRLASSLKDMKFINELDSSEPIGESLESDGQPSCVVVKPHDWIQDTFKKQESPDVTEALDALRDPALLKGVLKQIIKVAVSNYHQTFGDKVNEGLADCDVKIGVLLSYSFKVRVCFLLLSKAVVNESDNQ